MSHRKQVYLSTQRKFQIIFKEIQHRKPHEPFCQIGRVVKPLTHLSLDIIRRYIRRSQIRLSPAGMPRNSFVSDIYSNSLPIIRIPGRASEQNIKHKRVHPFPNDQLHHRWLCRKAKGKNPACNPLPKDESNQ